MPTVMDSVKSGGRRNILENKDVAIYCCGTELFKILSMCFGEMNFKCPYSKNKLVVEGQYSNDKLAVDGDNVLAMSLINWFGKEKGFNTLLDILNKGIDCTNN
jgi:hypothetical protein